MINLRERIEKILKVLQPSAQKEQISSAVDQILQAFEEMLPKERTTLPRDEVSSLMDYGFNSCLAQIRERTGEK